MKKSILALLAILVIAMFVVAGCGGQKASAPDDEPAPVPKKTAPSPAPEPEEETQMAKPEPKAAPEPEAAPEPAPTKAVSKKVAELLKKHSRVTSMNYLYQDRLNYPMEWPTYVKGSKMAIDLRELEEIDNDVFISKVYLDTSSKSAKAYCESKVYRCKDPNQALDVTFAKYKHKTPLEWIKEVTYAESAGEETMQQRLTVKITYEEDGKQVSMWVDDYYGIPMRVEIKDGSDVKKYIFEDLAINAVSDSDITHQLITETYKD